MLSPRLQRPHAARAPGRRVKTACCMLRASTTRRLAGFTAATTVVALIGSQSGRARSPNDPPSADRPGPTPTPGMSVNLRDLGELSPALKKRTLYRCSQVVQHGQLAPLGGAGTQQRRRQGIAPCTPTLLAPAGPTRPHADLRCPAAEGAAHQNGHRPAWPCRGGWVAGVGRHGCARGGGSPDRCVRLPALGF